MLTEQRYEQILKLLEKEGSITVTEVKELLDTSESTVRRDITALHNAGKVLMECRDKADVVRNVQRKQKITVKCYNCKALRFYGGSTAR